MYLYEKLLLLLDFLSEDELDYKIAEYVIYHGQEVLKLSLREFASRVYVSAPAIVRFIERLGIDDYQSFKNLLRNDLYYRKKETTDLNADQYQEVYELFEKINEQDLVLFVERLKNANKVVFHAKPIYWYIFRELMDRLRIDGKEVRNLTYKTKQEKMEMLQQLEENDIITMVFPSRDVMDVSVTHQRLEFEFIASLENSCCFKYFFGQVLSVYPKEYSVIQIPHLVNESMYYIYAILLAGKILNIYNKG